MDNVSFMSIYSQVVFTSAQVSDSLYVYVQGVSEKLFFFKECSTLCHLSFASTGLLLVVQKMASK